MTLDVENNIRQHTRVPICRFHSAGNINIVVTDNIDVLTLMHNSAIYYYLVYTISKRSGCHIMFSDILKFISKVMSDNIRLLYSGMLCCLPVSSKIIVLTFAMKKNGGNSNIAFLSLVSRNLNSFK